MAVFVELNFWTGEDTPRVYKDHRFEKNYTRTLPCKHARDEGDAWVVPFVINAVNQGGYDCTNVCLDCANEAVKTADWKEG